MDLNKLLGSHACSCGKTHTCGIKWVYIEDGAIKRLSETLEGYHHVLLVGDENTYGVCGEQVKSEISGKLDDLYVYPGKEVLIPNEEAVENMQAHVNAGTDVIVGIGSGVIQDLCKFVSHKNNLPYQIIATAPSMDGYASVGAAMIMGNMKVTYNAHVPEAILGDTNILKDAPMEMIQAGYGDILGKFSCLNDWKLSRAVNGEYFCQNVYDLTYDMLLRTKDLGPRLQKREKEAIQILMEALAGVGIAMAYVGNSRPASGSEHHLSHFFEVVGILKKEPYFAHGIDVVCSAVYTEKVREKILSEITWDEDAKREPSFEKACWESDIRSIYTDAADGVIALQNKLGWYEENRLSIYEEKWPEITAILKEAPSSKEMEAYLESVGLHLSDFEKTYGEEKIANALKYGKDLKDRYSVLWMYFDLFF